MRILSWLRRVVADFFCVEPDECDLENERNRQELAELRSLTMLAIAQARRTELELKDALDAGPPGSESLLVLVPRLEEQRARADKLMERYREREAEEEERLARLGQVRLTHELNERRRELRDAVGIASETSREEELVAMEDEARAEAFRLDVLDELDAGGGYEREPDDGGEEALAERGRQLLEDATVEPRSEQ